MIQHDGTLSIATGRSRNEVSWKNTETTWSALIARLAETHRTAETFAEYLSVKKDRQGEIKDIGGFVGGYLNGGRRKANTVAERSLLALDIDQGSADFWGTFQMLYDCGAALYSTHSHSPDAPRYRLLIPLDRSVFSDEYVAIGRRIAGVLGIEAFDNTTFEPHRLMYWPSTSKDGVYVFECQDGPWLGADDVLATYLDWRDTSAWPVSRRVDAGIQRELKKQGDPIEKGGVVGAFCRTYSIEQAIETFLADVYEPCGVESRFTFKEGSTAAGLVVYDDKFAYSHHSTDPASGKLCNAFDLVRLHKYGLKDEDGKGEVASNKAMSEFAVNDPAVKALDGRERLEKARQEFGDPAAENCAITETELEWTKDLDKDKRNNECKSTIDNIVIILKNDPLLKGCIAFDDFQHRPAFVKNVHWREVNPSTDFITDRDIHNLTHYLEKIYKISSTVKLEAALGVMCQSHRFHPVRKYLQSLIWDGRPRLDCLLVDYLGAVDSEYTRAVTRKAFVAAVARVFEPGIKFDYVLTLVGNQGIGKSAIIKKLGRNWFTDSFGTVQGKEAFEQIQGVWLVEIAELAGLRKADLETIKHFITKQEDLYRPAYGRRVENHPRQCVFVATTNNRDFLRDPTGGRRFWPVDTDISKATLKLFRDFNEDEVNQVWAEAKCLYDRREPLFLTPELEKIAAGVQSEHGEQDERSGVIQKYLETLVPENWQDMNVFERRAFLQGDELQPAGTVARSRITIAEIWCEALGGQIKDMTRYNTRELHDLMRKVNGWKEHTSKIRTRLYGAHRGYIFEKASVPNG